MCGDGLGQPEPAETTVDIQMAVAPMVHVAIQSEVFRNVLPPAPFRHERDAQPVQFRDRARDMICIVRMLSVKRRRRQIADSVLHALLTMFPVNGIE